MPSLSEAIEEAKVAILSGQPRPCFDPPYNSPIEHLFAWSALKYIRDDCEVDRQVKAKTICGNFYLDFVATAANGLRVAYECDGKEFHNPRRDEWRDAMILGAGVVDAIYRIRGCDIFYRINDVLYLLSRWDSCVFTERGSHNLLLLASRQAIECYENQQDHTSASAVIDGYRLDIKRRTRCGLESWRELYAFAVSVGGGRLDRVMRQF